MENQNLQPPATTNTQTPPIQNPKTETIPLSNVPKPNGKFKFSAKTIIFTIAFYLLIGLTVIGFLFCGKIASLLSSAFSTKEEISTPFRESDRFLTIDENASNLNKNNFRSAAGGFSVSIPSGYAHFQTPGNLVRSIDELSVINPNGSGSLGNFRVIVKKNLKTDGSSKYNNPKEYLEDYTKDILHSVTVPVSEIRKILLDGKDAYKVVISLDKYRQTVLIVVFREDLIYEFFGIESDQFQQSLSTFRFEEVKTDPTIYWFPLKLERLSFKIPTGWIVRESELRSNKPGLFINEQSMYFRVYKNSSINEAIDISQIPITQETVVSEKVIDGKPGKQFDLTTKCTDGKMCVTKRLFIQVGSDAYEMNTLPSVYLPYDTLPVVFNQIVSTFKFSK